VAAAMGIEGASGEIETPHGRPAASAKSAHVRVIPIS